MYTNGADRDAIVAPKFQQTIFLLLGGVRELNFNRLGWSDSEVTRLATVLPLCRQLTALELVSNAMGDAGLVALVQGLGGHGSLPCLRTLKLSYNRYGDVGLRALAALLRKPTNLPSLRVLWTSQQNKSLAAVCTRRGIKLEVSGSKRGWSHASSSGGGEPDSTDDELSTGGAPVSAAALARQLEA